jgi:hypothetical protein
MPWLYSDIEKSAKLIPSHWWLMQMRPIQFFRGLASAEANPKTHNLIRISTTTRVKPSQIVIGQSLV